MDRDLFIAYREFCGEEPFHFIRIKGDASARRIYRISGDDSSVIGVYGPDIAENRAFIGFTQTFRQLNLPVPELLYVNLTENCYLLEDLGDETLFSRLIRQRNQQPGHFSEAIKQLYLEAVGRLCEFQIRGAEKIDYSLCYQTAEFNETAWKTDHDLFLDKYIRVLQYREYEKIIENDLDAHREMLKRYPGELFLYRDFQSRNIMVTDKGLKFIDYQSGRKGHPAYDIASLAYDAKADLPDSFRMKLSEYHADMISSETKISRAEMLEAFPLYALLRVLQALGSYLRNAFAKGDAKFFESIPFGMKNVRELMENDQYLVKLTGLADFIYKIEEEKPWERITLS